MLTNILITGATGQVGGAVLRLLRERGGAADLNVIAASRRPEAGAQSATVLLDYDRIETLAPALRGVDRLLLVTGYSVDMLRQSKAVIDAAKAAGVRHIVHLGACGGDDTTVAHWGWHQFVERYIESSGMSWTHLRPEVFMQNLLGYGGARTVDHGVIHQFAGDARLSWVDCEDVAAVAAACLLDPVRHAGKTYRLGYEAASYHDIAAVFSEVLGQPYTYQPHPPEEFLATVLAAGADPAYMQCVYQNLVGYGAGTIPGVDEVFDNFAAITGRPPRGWRAFAAAHAERLRY